MHLYFNTDVESFLFLTAGVGCGLQALRQPGKARFIICVLCTVFSTCALSPKGMQ